MSDMVTFLFALLCLTAVSPWTQASALLRGDSASLPDNRSLAPEQRDLMASMNMHSAEQSQHYSACHHMKSMYMVVPGKSFGMLPEDKQIRWMAIHCDQFFCKPHALEGKGSYKCEPRDDLVTAPP